MDQDNVCEGREEKRSRGDLMLVEREILASRQGRLSYRERLFCHHYLTDCAGDADAAAKASGFMNAHCKEGYGERWMESRPWIGEAIGRQVEMALSREAVLSRLTSIAEGDLGEFIVMEDETDEKGNRTGKRRPTVDMDRAMVLGITDVIKKLKYTPEGGVEIELHDPMPAIKLLAQYHGMIVKKTHSLQAKVHIKATADEINRRFLEEFAEGEEGEVPQLADGRAEVRPVV